MKHIKLFENFEDEYDSTKDDFAERVDFFEGALDRYGEGRSKESIETAQNVFMDMVKHAGPNPEYKKRLHDYLSYKKDASTIFLRELAKEAGWDYWSKSGSTNLDISNAIDYIDSAHMHANDDN